MTGTPGPRINYELQCRICLEDGIIDIYENTFLTSEGEVKISDAYNLFSTLKDQVGDIAFATVLCESCTNQLIASYQFLLKLQKSDQRFLEELNVQPIDFNSMDAGILTDANNGQMTEDDVDIEEVYVADEIQFNKLYNPDNEIGISDEFHQKLLCDDIPIQSTGYKELNRNEPNPFDVDTESNNIIHQIDEIFCGTNSKPTVKLDSTKSNILLTSSVASLLKNSGAVPINPINKKSNSALDDTNHKRKLLDGGSSSGASNTLDMNDALNIKKSKVSPTLRIQLKDVISNIAVPQFVITSRCKSSSAADGGGCDDNEPLKEHSPGGTTIKTLNVSAVRMNSNGLMNFDTKDPIEPDVASEGSMYVCKYCPKAFATSHHLLLHTRKSHVCQFCLQGFTKVVDLHQHVKETHNRFECPLCSKEFASNSNLRAHIKRTHNVRLPANVSLMTIDQMR